MEYVLDSYAWLEYFGGNNKYAQYIEGNARACFTIATTLTEVVRSLTRKKVLKNEIMRTVGFIVEKTTILPIEKENAIRAGFIAEEKGLHFSDALIYSFADKNRRIVTGDKDFKSLENVEFV